MHRFENENENEKKKESIILFQRISYNQRTVATVLIFELKF